MRCRSMVRQFIALEAAPVVLALIALLASSVLALAGPRAKDEAPPPITAPLSDDARATLRDLLHFDPARGLAITPASPLRVQPKMQPQDLNWNRVEKADGSSALSVKKSLPTAWNANVGADFGFAAAPATGYQPDRPLPGSKEQNASGVNGAWATLALPGLASVDARVDPSKDQGKLGTTFSRSIPVGGNYAVTLQNSYAVTETLGVTPAAPAQVWSTDRLVKFNFLSTGTSLAAGTTSTTVDNVTRNKISAEQKLFDALNVTTTVTDLGSGRPSNKSISAGFKLKW